VSSNRVGPRFALDIAALDGAIAFVGNGWVLQEAKVDTSKNHDKSKLNKFEVGPKVRVEKFLGQSWTLPLELSGSFTSQSIKNDRTDWKSSAINFGMYAGVYKRWSLLGGYQKISSNDALSAFSKQDQTNLAAGLEYKIQDGAYLVALWNKVSVKNLSPAVEGFNPADNDFDQTILNTKITVGF
jgi:hypothetical protein